MNWTDGPYVFVGNPAGLVVRFAIPDFVNAVKASKPADCLACHPKRRTPMLVPERVLVAKAR
jgi:hypothetical protein